MPAETLRVGAQFDVGPIQAGMAQAVDAVESGTARMNTRFNRLGTESEAAMNKVAFSSTEARHALHGLGEEIGVHVPRFVQTFVAHMGGIGPLLASSFSAIAVVGLIQVLAEIPEVIDKGINKLYGWDEAARKAFQEATADAITFEHETIKLNEAVAKIGLIGKTGVDKFNLEMAIAVDTTQQLKDLQKSYNDRLEHASAEMKFLEEQTKLSGLAGKALFGGYSAIEGLALKFAGAGKTIEQDKMEVESLTKSMKELSQEIARREAVEKPTIAAEGIEAAKAEAEKLAREAAAEAHRQMIAELNDAERLAKEKIRLATEVARENAEFNKNYEAELKRMDAEIVRSNERALAQAVEAQKKELAEEERIGKLREKPWNDLFAAENRGIDQMVRGVLTGSRSISQVFARMGADIVSSTAAWLANALLKHAEHWVLVNVIEKSAMAESLTTFITGTAAKQSALATANIAQITSEAGLGAAAAFASVMEALPFPVNIATAPAMAATTFGSIESFAAVSAFEQGGIVPAGGLALLHPNEMVLPAPISQKVQQMAGGGGAHHHYHIAINASGSHAEIEAMVHAAIVPAIKRAQRNGEIDGR